MKNKEDKLKKDELEQKYYNEHIPVQDDSGIWRVQTGHGLESGDINYIAGEFSGMCLIYHFMHNGEMDHVHRFEDVLAELLQDPEHVDIVTDHVEYSEQQIQMVKAIKSVICRFTSQTDDHGRTA